MVRRSTTCMGVVAFLLVVSQSAAQVYETGLVFADQQVYESIPLAIPPLTGDLPASVDFSAGFPTPGHQGKQASCVGWAVAYAMKGYQEGLERKWPLDTTQHMFSPAYIYNQIKQPGNCRMGTRFVDALDLLTRKGCAPLDLFPYDESTCSKIPNKETVQQAKQYAIASWRRVNVQDRQEVQSHLAAGFPVLAGLLVYENFRQLSAGVVYKKTVGKRLSGHAMVIVGYSDEKNAMKLMNSWGTAWGDGGFAWIDYDTFRRLVKEGYVTQDIVVTRPPRRPDVPKPQPPLPPDKDPEPVSLPSISVPSVTIVHNIVTNGVNGFQITVHGRALHCDGRAIQLDTRFYYPNGVALRANPQEGRYRDPLGNVTTIPLRFTVRTRDFDLASRPIWMPYFGLNFAPTGGRAVNQVMAKTFVYLDNFLKGESLPVFFQFSF